MTAAVFDLDVAQTTLVAAGNTYLTGAGAVAKLCDAAPPADLAMPYAVAYPLGLDSAHPSLAVETLWPQKWQLTSVGLTPSQARKLGQLLDTWLTAVDTDGHYLHDLDLSAAGVDVRRRESNRDSYGDLSGILHTWVCTYTLDLQLI